LKQKEKKEDKRGFDLKIKKDKRGFDFLYRSFKLFESNILFKSLF